MANLWTQKRLVYNAASYSDLELAVFRPAAALARAHIAVHATPPEIYNAYCAGLWDGRHNFLGVSDYTTFGFHLRVKG